MAIKNFNYKRGICFSFWQEKFRRCSPISHPPKEVSSKQGITLWVQEVIGNRKSSLSKNFVLSSFFFILPFSQAMSVRAVQATWIFLSIEEWAMMIGGEN